MTAPTTPAPKPTPPPAQEDRAKSVVYVGEAGTREITAAQWKSAGVEDQKATIWNEDNEYSLPASDFSTDALEVLKRDRNIKVR